MCLNEEESIQHIFLDCPFNRECWEQFSSPLEMELNLSKTFNDLFTKWKTNYPYSMKNKQTIKRFWESLLSFRCWKIWLSRNKSIFKDQTPMIGRVMLKAWGPTLEFINMKGLKSIDGSSLQQEERNWISQATIKSN